MIYVLSFSRRFFYTLSKKDSHLDFYAYHIIEIKTRRFQSPQICIKNIENCLKIFKIQFEFQNSLSNEIIYDIFFLNF